MPTKTDFLIEEVKRLVVKPGEVLLVRLAPDTSKEALQHVSRTLKQVFNYTKVLLFAGDIEFTIVEDKSNQ